MLMHLKDRLRRHIPRLPRRATTPSWRHSFRLLDRYGFRPNTVFDIGVAYGTFELYQAFPKAFYHLIDPTSESLHHMRLLERQLTCRIHQVALGNREGEVDIEIRPDIQAATLQPVAQLRRPILYQFQLHLREPRPEAGDVLRQAVEGGPWAEPDR